MHVGKFVSASADVAQIVFTFLPKTVRVWQVRDKECSSNVMGGNTDEVPCLSLSADREEEAPRRCSNTLWIWKIRDCEWKKTTVLGSQRYWIHSISWTQMYCKLYSEAMIVRYQFGKWEIKNEKTLRWRVVLRRCGAWKPLKMEQKLFWNRGLRQVSGISYIASGKNGGNICTETSRTMEVVIIEFIGYTA